MSRLVERYQRLLTYERDAGSAVLGALATVPPAERTGPEISRALAIAAHAQGAKLEWLWRLTSHASPACAKPERIFFDAVTLGEVEAMTAEADTAWAGYGDELTEAELARVAEFSSTAGRPYRATVADIITHVVNHASYHRGQVAMLIRQAGGTPAVSDFIFYAYRDPDRG
ncbi:MAG: DinB family protein [Planctomycetota bacterium]